MNGSTGLAVLALALCVAVSAQSAPYDETAAIEAVRFAGASYCQAATIAKWSCPSCKALNGVSNATVQYAASADVQSFVAYDANAQRVWVVFRGTNPLSIQDWLDDLTFTQTNPYTQCPSCGVHEGFYDSFMDLRDGILAAVQPLLSANPTAEVHITGHSLGAAMAQLCAVDFAVNEGINATTVYTFGEPRIGSPQWTPFYESVIAAGTYRVVHWADPVPHVPLEAMDFHHQPTEVFYTESQDSFKVCDHSGEDKTCADGLLVPVWVPDHLNYLGFDFTANYLACAL